MDYDTYLELVRGFDLGVSLLETVDTLGLESNLHIERLWQSWKDMREENKQEYRR